MMNFEEQMVAHCPTEATAIKRIVRILESNGVNSMDILLEKSPYDLQIMKGIGERSLVILGRIMTKERVIREKGKDHYEKMRGNKKVRDLKYYIQERCGKTYLEACTCEHYLKKNGVRDMNVLLNTSDETIAAMRGIGQKRLELIRMVKRFVLEDQIVKSVKRNAATTLA